MYVQSSIAIDSMEQAFILVKQLATAIYVLYGLTEEEIRIVEGANE